jgi:hypothetical protein
MIDYFQKFLEPLSRPILNNLFGGPSIWEFDAEEDRTAQTWYVWTGIKDNRKFTITHKSTGYRYDGPKDLYEYVCEKICKEKIKQAIKESC